MRTPALSSFVATASFISQALCYGTTVQVYPATCRAVPSGQPTQDPALPAQYRLSIAPGPGDLVTRQVARQYVLDNGTVTTDCDAAALYSIDNGRLSTRDGRSISTDTNVSYSSMAASSVVREISTTFSVTGDSMLAWTNAVFAVENARFCVLGTMVKAVFGEQFPTDCLQISLTYSLAGECPSSDQSSASTEPTYSTGSAPLTTDATTDTTGATSVASDPTSGPGSSGGSSLSLTGTTSSASSYPTSSGEPNCADRSPYDFTVNDGYLILCNTELRGSDIMAVDADDLAECIDACDQQRSQNPGDECLAVTLDPVAETGGCMLMSDVGIVEAGADRDSQAAISVTGPNPPEIVFAGDSSSATSPISSSSSTFSAASSTTSGSMATSGPPSSSAMTTLDVSTTNSASDSPDSSAADFSMSSAISEPFGSSSSSVSDLSSTSSATTSPPGPNSSSSVSGSVASSSSSVPGLSSSASTASIPTSEDSSSSGLSGSTTSSSTDPSSSSESVSTSATAATTAPSSSSAVPTSSGSSSASSLASSTPSSSVSTTSSSTSSTAAPSPTPVATDPSEPLCPSYDGQVVRVGGNLYQVFCSTNLEGDVLPDETTRADSQSECARFCNLYNAAIPFGCIGTTFVDGSSNANCFLWGRISGQVESAEQDAMKLIYPGNPQPETSGSSATATATDTASAASSASTASANPSQEPLCPASDDETQIFSPSYGESTYQVFCDTSYLNGTTPSTGESSSSLSPVTATDLRDCIDHCTFLNLFSGDASSSDSSDSDSDRCAGVTFQTDPTGPSGENCFPVDDAAVAAGGSDGPGPGQGPDSAVVVSD